jgi:non-heme chloroperoxidase
MSMITVKDGTTIYYKDWGPKNAQPIVFHHGWPLSADDWDTQMLYFLGNGYRVVAHDRAPGDDGRCQSAIRRDQGLLGD